MSLLQRIFKKYLAEEELCDNLAKCLQDLRDAVKADELLPDSVSYMREAQKVLIRYKVRKSIRDYKGMRSFKGLLSETEEAKKADQGTRLG